jgi:hypothetical protein
VPVTYRLVRNPPVAGTISVRVKDGSSVSWLQVQALDTGNPLARVEAQEDGRWRALIRSGDGYWTAASPGLGDGPFTLRITDVFGQQVTIEGVQLAPGVVQPTGARLYPAAAASPGVGPSAPSTTGPPSDDHTALPPPLSLPPSPARVLAPPSTDLGPDGAGADQDAAGTDDGRDHATHHGDGSIWPVFVLLAALLVLARALVWRKGRGRGRQGFRATPQ